MEKKEVKKSAPVSASKCCVAETSVGHFIIKMFLALVMIGLALVIAIIVVMSIGRGWKSACRDYGYMKVGDPAQVRMLGDKFEGKIMLRDGSGVAYKFTKEAPVMSERIYGNILKIEDNLITILNNAAKEQVIVSRAETVIVSSTTEVGISALETGQNIIVFGSPDEEGLLVAKMINIQ
jgi:hypothetical protein